MPEIKWHGAIIPRLRAGTSARPPRAAARGHASSIGYALQTRAFVGRADLVRCATPSRGRAFRDVGTHPPLKESRRFRTPDPVFLPALGRDGRTAYPALAPVGETGPEAQSRRDRFGSTSLRQIGWHEGCLLRWGSAPIRAPPSRPPKASFRRASRSSPGPLSVRAPAARRDTQPSCARSAHADHVSHLSRRSPSLQRHADGADSFQVVI